MDQASSAPAQVIVCPWCGTNYTSFRPNCQNCGGPLPAPRPAPSPTRVAAAELPPADVDEIEIPPPPPREISDRYRWKLFWGNALRGLIFALVGFFIMTSLCSALPFSCIPFGIPFLGGGESDVGPVVGLGVGAIIIAAMTIPTGLGLIFLVGGLRGIYLGYRRAAQTVDVLRYGEAVLGQIVGVQPNTSITVNGQPRWDIFYQFQWNRRVFQNEVTTSAFSWPGPQFAPGRRICVLCLPTAPERNTLYPHPATSGGMSVQQIEQLLMSYQAEYEQITRAGVPAAAKILQYRPMGITANGNNPVVDLVLEVQPANSPAFVAPVRGVCVAEFAVAKYQPGQMVTVRYLPHDLQKVALQHSGA